ncbi:MAG TPA: hypothetical protein VFP84_29345 [Kofleriaceae bacterium]|nr:hypothetical protein [Kofleriaceae bacterium]
MPLRWTLIALVLVLAAPVAVARQKIGNQVGYVGIHPIPKSEGGGICYIEGPHVHIYAANKLEYRTHGDDHVFVGDPVAYGWDGPKYAYKGPHPIHVDVVVGGEPDVEYCYLEGPHYHNFAPPEGPSFKLVGGAYFYVGDPPRAFLDARPTYVGINETYRPLVYVRPVIEVDAPVGWIGARVEVLRPVVVAPSVHIGIEIGAPAVIVVPHGKYKHRKYKRHY